MYMWALQDLTATWISVLLLSSVRYIYIYVYIYICIYIYVYIYIHSKAKSKKNHRWINPKGFFWVGVSNRSFWMVKSRILSPVSPIFFASPLCLDPMLCPKRTPWLLMFKKNHDGSAVNFLQFHKPRFNSSSCAQFQSLSIHRWLSCLNWVGKNPIGPYASVFAKSQYFLVQFFSDNRLSNWVLKRWLREPPIFSQLWSYSPMNVPKPNDMKSWQLLVSLLTVPLLSLWLHYYLLFYPIIIIMIPLLNLLT